MDMLLAFVSSLGDQMPFWWGTMKDFFTSITDKINHLNSSSVAPCAQIKTHSHAVSALVEHDGIIVTGSSDMKLKLWNLPELDNTNESSGGLILEFTQKQVIDTGKRFPIALAMSKLPGTSVQLLAVGLTDTKIRVFVASGSQFAEAAVLQGHEDWIKALDFSLLYTAEDGISYITLASGSQDGTIRLWDIRQAPEAVDKPTKGDLDDQLLDAFEASLGEVGAEETGRQISMKQHIVKVTDGERAYNFHITLDALLIGHDAGVTDVTWMPSPNSRILLSTSVDSSVILWSSSDSTSQIWTNRYRFGDVGGQRLGGFVGGLWVDANQAVAFGWNGSFRRWNYVNDQWHEVQAVTGHSAPVHGIDWEPSGRYFISASLDQTVRIHGPVEDRWTEIARAQTHGYDCIQACFLSDLRFASISDEKVARVFDAPGAFVRLASVLGLRSTDEDVSARPVAANVPPLGLSNKALSEDNVEQSVNSLERAPYEAELASVTLWPEIEKIFGHGYESISLAVSRSKALIATTCKATTAKHAVVRLYDSQSFKPFGTPLEGHTLTITRVAFSKDDEFILAGGKDRTWHLWKRNEDGGYSNFIAGKGHARVKIWDATGDQSKLQKPLANLKMEQPATAACFSSIQSDGRILMAIGLETGEVQIYASELPFEQWKLMLRFPPNVTHIDQIRQLAWRPSPEGLFLASCSDDGSVRVMEITQ
ncbi:related to ELP2-29 kDa subunit of elongator and elongating RNA polymerase II holoenzyme [Serendipita indica DSM 11827]|uniref:Elongator complex protein 2 n=1 Tax=Serendipita indica (strain DSM 11827) TaxID=1109443 RepID=G4T7I8_SERID|nr:related to ELP2-29 kDa subunit of elongator and elongating RNA polymerase II holoenzyme [Serendipita indica DSM 11827]